jgi:hypothetical protein
VASLVALIAYMRNGYLIFRSQLSKMASDHAPAAISR